MIIETIETVRQTYFLDLLFKSNHKCLFVGPTGTGKSSIVANYLHKLSPENYLLINLSFSARTSASQTQDIIMSKMGRLVKNFEL